MKKILLIMVALAASFTLSAQYKAPMVIANSGFHKAPSSGTRNSMSALKAAQKAKVYASECDVCLSKDDEVMVLAGGWHPNRKAKNRVYVPRTTSDKLLNVPFPTGECPSTLEQFLKRAAKKPKTKLLIELKNHGSTTRESQLVDYTLGLVSQHNMEANVAYLAFHPWTCFQLAKSAPKGTSICYLSGNYTPEYVKGMGCDIFGCNINKLKKNKKWIKQAQKLGMKVNVWTVDKEADITWCIQNGVDYITTNDVKLTQSLIKSLCK